MRTIISFTEQDIEKALIETGADIEDNVQFVLAKKQKCFIVVTNNYKDYRFLQGIVVLRPAKVRKIRLYIRLFVHSSKSFVHSSIYPSIRSFVYISVYSFIRLNHSFIRLRIHLPFLPSSSEPPLYTGIPAWEGSFSSLPHPSLFDSIPTISVEQGEGCTIGGMGGEIRGEIRGEVKTPKPL